MILEVILPKVDRVLSSGSMGAWFMTSVATISSRQLDLNALGQYPVVLMGAALAIEAPHVLGLGPMT